MERYETISLQPFSEQLQLIFRSLYQDGKYADITVVSDDKTQFKAHKIVLSAFSQKFKKIIDKSPSQNHVLDLIGIQSNEIASLLQFMYLGEVKIHVDRIEQFIKAATYLEVTEISDRVGKQNDKENISENEIVLDNNGEENETEDVESKAKQSKKMQARNCHQVAKYLEVEEISKGVELPKVEEVVMEEIFINDEENKKIYEDNEPKKALMNKMKQKDSRNQISTEAKSCTECGKEFYNKENMVRHYRSKHEVIKYPCDQCDYQATAQRSLQEHIESKHEGLRYVCHLCDYQAYRERNLKSHFQSRHAHEEKETDEDSRPKQTSDNQIRQRQPRNQISSDAKPTECPECGKEFARKFVMLTHYRSVHEGIKYPCDQCDYQATDSGNLQRHIQSKHECIKYPCNQCDSKLTRRSHLKSHIKAKHSGNIL